MKWNRQRATWAGLALIVVTNAVALGGVAFNRSGEPDARLALTERELDAPHVPRGDRAENSGLSLRLRWRTLPAFDAQDESGTAIWMQGDSGAPWLDVPKMISLGFAAPTAADGRAAGVDERGGPWLRQLERTVLLVLELDGPAHREAVRRAGIADRKLAAARAAASAASQAMPASPIDGRTYVADERLFDSRLFVVDAGLDRDALRSKYPDRAMYAIVPGRVRTVATSGGRPRGGEIKALAVESLNVPQALRAVFDTGCIANERDCPAFSATMAVGRKSEPWLEAVAPRERRAEAAATR